MSNDKTIPVTVFTGFLGSGKTTTILQLIKQLPEGYKVCLLKNEFGDVAVDSLLAKETNIGVQEMMNGCMCCVLVGQMKLALLELKEKYNPDRIIVETSGSAFPQGVSLQVRDMEPDGFALDSIITVVDCVNFRGYEDTSYTAKLQAQYSDVILLNKHELVSERELDLVIDHVNELNTDTPKVKSDANGGVSPDLVFGLDTQLFKVAYDKLGHMEEMVFDPHHQENEVDLLQVIVPAGHGMVMSRAALDAWLVSLPKDDVYRVKGFVRVDGGEMTILNHAFGRYTLTPVAHEETLADSKDIDIKITIMGQDLRFLQPNIEKALVNGNKGTVQLIEAHRH
ncbi:CobW/HypB/UreG, nucleotide-binding domain-containing protein [Gongronella butleri]|nr:CobW/HypB/UreG, nucleotide-binding domain-containing protein [Gongronella butleri]